MIQVCVYCEYDASMCLLCIRYKYVSIENMIQVRVYCEYDASMCLL